MKILCFAPIDKVDTVVEETEKIADSVEEAAETVDKVVKDVAEHLPEGGKLKDAAMFVDGVAEEIAREAHLAKDFLHEVFIFSFANLLPLGYFLYCRLVLERSLLDILVNIGLNNC